MVDDDDDLRLLARVVLADAGFDVDEATGGAEALEVLESTENIDLVVLDIRMPTIDGFAVLERLRAVDLLKNYKIVAVSGHAEKDTVARVIAEGALAFIQKPFLPEELVAAVNAASQ